MTKSVSLFSGYSQKENRITNYCLLVLKLIYDESPSFLGEALSQLIGENISAHIGVRFRQQERKGQSVPDGLIFQSAVTVFIEKQYFDWFYDDQLKKHLSALSEQPGHKILLALSAFESETFTRFKRIESQCRTDTSGQTLFRAVTFGEFLSAVQPQGLSKRTTEAIADFAALLNEENLLTSWDKWLDVVNCSTIPEDVLEHGVYMCPAAGGSYSHGRCRYFGMYRNKRVELVAEIEAVVDVDLDSKGDQAGLLWRNKTRAGKQELLDRATAKVSELRPHEGPTRVFLLGQLHSSDFQKNTPYGMRGSKQYFDISRLNARSAEELATELTGKTWTQLQPL